MASMSSLTLARDKVAELGPFPDPGFDVPLQSSFFSSVAHKAFDSRHVIVTETDCAWFGFISFLVLCFFQNSCPQVFPCHTMPLLSPGTKRSCPASASPLASCRAVANTNVNLLAFLSSTFLKYGSVVQFLGVGVESVFRKKSNTNDYGFKSPTAAHNGQIAPNKSKIRWAHLLPAQARNNIMH